MASSSSQAQAFAVIVVAALASQIFVSPAVAQSSGDWRPVAVTQSPPARTGFALAPMPDGDLLLFGGDIGNPAATEWRWNGFDWQPLTRELRIVWR